MLERTSVIFKIDGCLHVFYIFTLLLKLSFYFSRSRHQINPFTHRNTTMPNPPSQESDQNILLPVLVRHTLLLK